MTNKIDYYLPLAKEGDSHSQYQLACIYEECHIFDQSIFW